jgi:hypothetical protein
MAKGNQSINKSLAKDVENGHIVQELPQQAVPKPKACVQIK